MNARRIIDRLPGLHRHILVLAATPWILALLALCFDYEAALSLASTETEMASVVAKTPSVASIKETPLTKDEYDRIAAALSTLRPGAAIRSDQRGIEIRVGDPQNYETWLAALDTLPAVEPAVRWRAAEICAGAKCNTQGLYALVGGTHATVVESR